MKKVKSAAVWLYLLHVGTVLLFITIGMGACRKLVGQTGWRCAIDVFKFLHICGEKLARHIRRMMPE